MDYILVHGLIVNPRLQHFQDLFDISQYAFVVQCSNSLATSLLHLNPALIRPEYQEVEPLKDLENEDESDQENEDNSDRETPAADCSPTAWLFPQWTSQRPLYTFGTSSRCNIILPRETNVSRKHFAIYLSQNGVWIGQNISRYGTSVDGDRLGFRDGQALNPDVQNNIRMGDFKCSIHIIPHVPLLHSPEKVSFLLEEELNFESDGTRTTSATSEYGVQRPLYVPKEAYHYLLYRRVPAQGESEIFMALQKAVNGNYCIAKVYGGDEEEKAIQQYELIRQLQNVHHVVPYNELISTDTNFRIITPYLKAVSLEQYLEPQNRGGEVHLSFVLFKQMTGALAWLQENGIVHNDISEYTILVDCEAGRYTTHLTGFSEITQALENSDCEPGFHRDLTNLTSLIERMLPTSHGGPCCDPPWASLMAQVFVSKITAHEINVRLQAMSPGYEHPPFEKSAISKKMKIKRIVDENNAEAVRLTDFLRIILHHSPRHTKATELAIQKVIRQKDLIHLQDDIYCSLHDAERLLHYLSKNNHFVLLDLTPPKHNSACWYETEHNVDVPIIYHAPNGMVNVTQIFNLFDNMDVGELFGKLIARCCREVLGSSEWEGHYIDKVTMRYVFEQLHLDTRSMDPAVLDLRKENLPNDSDACPITIATREMVGQILYYQNSQTVRWFDETMTAEAALKICGDHGLIIAQEALGRATKCSSNPFWASSYTNNDILGLFDFSDDSECPTTATSHNSFQRTDNQSGFVFKRSKSNSNVPILPEQQGMTAVEKVKWWNVPELRVTRNFPTTIFGPNKPGEPNLIIPDEPESVDSQASTVRQQHKSNKSQTSHRSDIS